MPTKPAPAEVFAQDVLPAVRDAFACNQHANEYRFADGRKWRFDYAFWGLSGNRVAVEVDGGRFCSKGGGKHGLPRDREKMNVAAAMGWAVIRLTADELTGDEVDTEYCVSLILSALTGNAPPAVCPPAVRWSLKEQEKRRRKVVSGEWRGAKPKARKPKPALQALDA